MQDVHLPYTFAKLAYPPRSPGTRRCVTRTMWANLAVRSALTLCPTLAPRFLEHIWN